MIVFFTYLIIMLKKLGPLDHSFGNIISLCKKLAKEINDEVALGIVPPKGPGSSLPVSST